MKESDNIDYTYPKNAKEALHSLPTAFATPPPCGNIKDLGIYLARDLPYMGVMVAPFMGYTYLVEPLYNAGVDARVLLLGMLASGLIGMEAAFRTRAFVIHHFPVLYPRTSREIKIEPPK